MRLRRKLHRLTFTNPQHPQRMSAPNFFTLLGVKPACQIDLDSVEQHYRQAQAKWHPDRFVNATAAERLAALQQTSLLNDAYTTLKTPLRRAEHLLAVLDGDDCAHSDQKLDKVFLLQQLELREELETLVHDRNLDGLASLYKTVTEQLNSQWQTFSAQIQEQDWCAARLGLQKLQFLQKLQDEITHSEDRLLDH
jgi:molecular chaperone HscB